jgi:hypothetical protein
MPELPPGPHHLDDLDVEQEHADRNDKVADRDWHLPVRDERNGEHRLGERHVQEEGNHVEERKRDDQVHDTWLSSRERYIAKRQARAAPRRVKFRARSTKLRSPTAVVLRAKQKSQALRTNVACLWPLATFELIINLKSTTPISESFLLRADEVILAGLLDAGGPLSA